MQMQGNKVSEQTLTKPTNMYEKKWKGRAE